MEIKHDYSYISDGDRAFVDHGYGCEHIRNLRFNFVYTEAQKNATQAKAQSFGLNSPEWTAHCAEAARMRSNHMSAVMEAIAEKHLCYQYNKSGDSVSFSSDEWDLFFWCNHFHNTMRGVVPEHELSKRDYSYFTLGFNDAQPAKKQKEVYESIMEILAQFQEDENIEVAVQYEIVLDEAKIRESANEVAASLIGKRTTYSPSGGIILFPGFAMEGRIVESNGNLFFMKKRARNKGYLLSDKEILTIFWSLPVSKSNSK